jgi:hypothetical protein
MKTRFLILAAVVLCTGVYAQTDDVYSGDPVPAAKPRKQPLREREWFRKVSFGGNFQAWFGNPSFVFLSPSVAYRPIEQFQYGVGFIYNYYRLDAGQYGRYQHNVFGSHTFMRYIIKQNYMVQVQFDRLRQPDFYSPNAGERTWVDYVLVGGGMRNPISRNAAITSVIMYNLTPHPLSIYPSRLIIQFGIMAGF